MEVELDIEELKKLPLEEVVAKIQVHASTAQVPVLYKSVQTLFNMIDYISEKNRKFDPVILTKRQTWLHFCGVFYDERGRKGSKDRFMRIRSLYFSDFSQRESLHQILNAMNERLKNRFTKECKKAFAIALGELFNEKLKAKMTKQQALRTRGLSANPGDPAYPEISKGVNAVASKRNMRSRRNVHIPTESEAFAKCTTRPKYFEFTSPTQGSSKSAPTTEGPTQTATQSSNSISKQINSSNALAVWDPNNQVLEIAAHSELPAKPKSVQGKGVPGLFHEFTKSAGKRKVCRGPYKSEKEDIPYYKRTKF